MDRDEASGTKPVTVPPPEETAPDENGIRTITEYFIRDGKKMKRTKRVQTQRRTVVTHPAAEERRRRWQKFGDAAIPGHNENITYHSFDPVIMERPGQETGEDDLAQTIRARMGRGLRRGVRAPGTPGLKDSERSSGAYVPPSMRGAAGAGVEMKEDRTKIRLSNLSKNATEDDVRELCTLAGRRRGVAVHITRVHVAKDRDTNIPRGFAYVSFASEDDAAAAKEELHGLGYDHLILNTEWAKPRNPAEGGGGLAGGFVSGYGKALPQNR